MSAVDALNAARIVGMRLGIDGDDLTWEAEEQPPPAIIDLLKRHKTGVVALLRPASDDWTAHDWQAYYDERAAIAEFDNGLPRDQAEARAFDCCVAQWLNRNPICSSPDCCLACGEPDQPDDPLLPFGIARTGRAWLHSSCWTAWEASRKREAVAALSSLGIVRKQSLLPSEMSRLDCTPKADWRVWIGAPASPDTTAT